MKHYRILLILCLLLPSVHADLFRFYAITRNDRSEFAQYVGESQLFMNVFWMDSGLARLVFVNDGPEDAVISEIYFDYSPALNLNLVSIGNGTGVRFSAEGVSPANLPAGRSIFTPFYSDLAVGAMNPSPHNGIRPGENLELIMRHDEAYTLTDALAAEDLRVGLHVISIGEYSESFVNVVPEPSSLPLLVSGTLLLRLVRTSRTGRKKNHVKCMPLTMVDEPNGLQWVDVQPVRDHGRKPRNRCEAAIRKATS